MQIQFIDQIVEPVYRTLALLDPAAEEPYKVHSILDTLSSTNS